MQKPRIYNKKITKKYIYDLEIRKNFLNRNLKTQP